MPGDSTEKIASCGTMSSVALSIMLLTTGKQPLLQFSIQSLVNQIRDGDEFTLSINSVDKEAISRTRALVKAADPLNKIQIIQTPVQLSVYEHYRFAIDRSLNDYLLIAHDDEIYNSQILEEFRFGFSQPDVTVVVGGLLMVEPVGGTLILGCHNDFTESKVRNGLEWIKATDGLYPRFCFSSLAINKRVLNREIFNARSTSADCLAVTQQAISGNVYHSKKVFATWLQLPSRNSRWYMINPGLTAPWREYSDYYRKLGEADLIERGEKAKKASLRSFTWLLFTAAVYRRNPVLINSCLEKIAEISPPVASLLSPVRWPVVYYPASAVLGLIALIKNFHKRCSSKNHAAQSIDPAEILRIDPELWSAYSATALQL